MGIPDGNAYWARDTEIKHNDERHVRYIIDDPPRFGLTREQVNEAYARHKEPIGWEGKAREELIKRACATGWIRIRHYPHDADRYLSVQGVRLQERRAEVHWILRSIVESGGIGDARMVPLRLLDFEADRLYVWESVQDYLDGAPPQE